MEEKYPLIRDFNKHKETMEGVKTQSKKVGI